MREDPPNWHSLLKDASSDVRRLSAVDRYSSIPVVVKENVGEHLFWVPFYAMLIHRELGGPKEYDAPIMLLGLAHDIPECLTGDVVRVFKYSSQEFRTAVNKAEKAVVESKFPKRVLGLLREAENGGLNAYGRWYVDTVVKAADFMSLYEYMWREKNKGNAEIEPFMERMRADLMKMSESFRETSRQDQLTSEVSQEMSHLYHAMATFFEQRYST